MTDDLAEESAPLARALALALDAGSEAEEAVRPSAVPSLSPTGQNWPFVNLVARWSREALFAPSPDQVRRACGRLDEFAQALAELAGQIDDDALADATSRAARWSDQLWENQSNASTVYNDVRSTVATLMRYRINLILKRPITGSDV